MNLNNSFSYHQTVDCISPQSVVGVDLDAACGPECITHLCLGISVEMTTNTEMNNNTGIVSSSNGPPMEYSYSSVVSMPIAIQTFVSDAKSEDARRDRLTTLYDHYYDHSIQMIEEEKFMDDDIFDHTFLSDYNF